MRHRVRPGRGVGTRTVPLVLLAVLVTGLATVASANGAAPPCPPFTLVAHRGIGPADVENTIPAFEEAHRQGYRTIETDVRITADDRFVLSHDRDLRRTTGRPDRVARLRAADLEQVRTVGGPRIPSLRRVLGWARSHDVRLILHLKYSPERLWTAGRLKRLHRIVGEAGMAEQVTYLAFSARSLRTIEEMDSTHVTAWVPDSRPTAAEVQETADMVMLSADQADAGLVRAMHEADVGILGAATQTPAELAALGRAGVARVVTDDLRPDLAKTLSREARACQGRRVAWR